MLYLTQTPFNLVKFHICKDNPDSKYINIVRTDDIQQVKDLLLEGVSYDEDGELIPSSYLIYYTGKQTIRELKMNKLNTTHLVVTDFKEWKHLKANKSIQFFDVKPAQYAYTIQGLGSIMTKEAARHFWSQYCIGKFNSNPYKWYNEGSYLLCLYQERKKKFTKEDIDCIYNSVSDHIKPYLKKIFTEEGKKYILQMTDQELFVIFIGSVHRKALLENYLVKVKPEFLATYMLFKEAFFKGTIRLREAAVILDFLLNKEKIIEEQELKNLFGI